MIAAVAHLGAAADWLGTFAVHSTVALAAVCVATWWLGRRALAAQELMLRVAPWLALVSSALQVGCLGCPIELQLPALPPLPELPALTDIAVLPAPAGPAELAPAVGSGAPAAPFVLPQWSWSALLVGAAAAAASLGLAWLARGQWRLRRALRDRTPETDVRVLAAVAAVARDQGLAQTPRLSRCAALGSPIAFGWLRPEICLPQRTGELADEPLRALLAHEVAHLRRGDPLWTWAGAALQALFPWQVLFVPVRRRWSRLVELRCDAIAAAHSSPTAVARCLLEVAGWLRPPATVPALALGMAARPSALRERIDAALAARPVAQVRRAAATAVGLCALASLIAAVPGVRTFVADAAGGVAPEPHDAATVEVPLAATSPASASAPAPAPSPAPDATAAAFVRMQQEHTALLEEVAALQADLRGRRTSPELELLIATLSRRLLAVERLRDRLQAQLDRRSQDADR